MKTATIYSNGSQECERMASLLKNLGGEFLEYKLNKHFTQKSVRARVWTRSYLSTGVDWLQSYRQHERGATIPETNGDV